jgi:hypothetical protein
MNCVNHPETAATAFCRECGKPMCAECRRPALGSIYCAEHLPASAAPPRFVPQVVPPPPPPPPGIPSPYTAPYGQRPADPSVHPGLALFLGFFPGVGAIYNGQYAKGLIHAVVFGLMVSVLNNSGNAGIQALLGIMVATWIVYQAFEAYHTARKRRFGLAVEEFSSLFDMKTTHGRFPAGAIVLIGLGFVLLLDTTGIINVDVLVKYWPALLIFVGVYLLYARSHSGSGTASTPTEGGFPR